LQSHLFNLVRGEIAVVVMLLILFFFVTASIVIALITQKLSFKKFEDAVFGKMIADTGNDSYQQENVDTGNDPYQPATAATGTVEQRMIHGEMYALVALSR